MTLFNNNICDLLLFNNNIHLSDSVLFVLYASTFVSLFEFQYLLVMVMLYDHLSRSLYISQYLQYQFCRCLTRLNSLSNLSY